MSIEILADKTIRTSNWSSAFKIFAWIGILCSIGIFIAWTCDSAQFINFIEAIGATISLFAMSALFSAISAITEHLAQKDKLE